MSVKGAGGRRKGMGMGTTRVESAERVMVFSSRASHQSSISGQTGACNEMDRSPSPDMFGTSERRLISTASSNPDQLDLVFMVLIGRVQCRGRVCASQNPVLERGAVDRTGIVIPRADHPVAVRVGSTLLIQREEENLGTLIVAIVNMKN